MIAGGEAEEHGGLRSLVMEQRKLEDRYKGHIRAKVEPSTAIKTGICMEVNDHYEVEDAENVIGCDAVISILEEKFDASIERSEWIIDQVMALK